MQEGLDWDDGINQHLQNQDQKSYYSTQLDNSEQQLKPSYQQEIQYPSQQGTQQSLQQVLQQPQDTALIPDLQNNKSSERSSATGYIQSRFRYINCKQNTQLLHPLDGSKLSQGADQSTYFVNPVSERCSEYRLPMHQQGALMDGPTGMAASYDREQMSQQNQDTRFQDYKDATLASYQQILKNRHIETSLAVEPQRSYQVYQDHDKQVHLDQQTDHSKLLGHDFYIDHEKQQQHSNQVQALVWQAPLDDYSEQLFKYLSTQYQSCICQIILCNNPYLLSDCLIKALGDLKQCNLIQQGQYDPITKQIYQSAFKEAYVLTMEQQLHNDLQANCRSESRYLVRNSNICVQLLRHLPEPLTQCSNELQIYYTDKVKNDTNFGGYQGQPALLRMYCQTIALMIQNQQMKLMWAVFTVNILLDHDPSEGLGAATQLEVQVGIELFLQVLRLVQDSYQQLKGTTEFQEALGKVQSFKAAHFDQSDQTWNVINFGTPLKHSRKLRSYHKEQLQDKPVHLQYSRSDLAIHPKDILCAQYCSKSQSVISSNTMNQVVVSNLDGIVTCRLQDQFQSSVFEIDQFGDSAQFLLCENYQIGAFHQKMHCHIMSLVGDVTSPRMVPFSTMNSHIQSVKALTQQPLYIVCVEKQRNFSNSRGSAHPKYKQSICVYDVSRTESVPVSTINQEHPLSGFRYEWIRSDIRASSKVANNDSMFLTGSQWLLLWDFRSRRPLAKAFGGKEGAHTDTCMTLDGDFASKLVVSGGKDLKLKMWDMRMERTHVGQDQPSYDPFLNNLQNPKAVKLDTSCPLQMKMLRNTSVVACSTPLGLYTLNTSAWHSQAVEMVNQQDCHFYQSINWIDQGQSTQGLIATKQKVIDYFRIEV